MPTTRRDFVKLTAAGPFLATMPVLGDQPAAEDSLRSKIRQTADLLGLPGFVAGVVRNGKLSFVQAEGFADLESRTPMRQDHIFILASLTKTFTSVTIM
jgi:CubicO group peptidase (beta-lactamase class C family)